MGAASRRWGSLLAPADPASTDPFQSGYSYVAREIRLDHHGGAVRFVSNTYRSYGESPQMLETWPRSWPGWKREGHPSAVAPAPEWAIDGLANWSLGRLGVTGGMHRGVQYRIVSAPYWLLMVFAGAPAMMLGLRSLRRRDRARGGRCTGCGYELGGLAGCPECGPGPAGGA